MASVILVVYLTVLTYADAKSNARTAIADCVAVGPSRGGPRARQAAAGAERPEDDREARVIKSFGGRASHLRWPEQCGMLYRI